MDDGQRAARLRLIQAGLSLVYLAAVVWMMMVPPHRRAELKLRAISAARNMASGSARRAGDASMAVEIRTGCEDYRLPYRLSLAREWLARAYERMTA
jgi:hypothetical protein